MGANINRRTLETVRRAELVDLHADNLWLDISKQIDGNTLGGMAENRRKGRPLQNEPLPSAAPTTSLLIEPPAERALVPRDGLS